MSTKHSAVCYIYNRDEGFQPQEKAHSVRNDLGIDLFAYNGKLYEGQTGLQIHDKLDLPGLKDRIERISGMEKLRQIIDDNIKRNGLSPRYTNPDEKRQDVFPSNKDENLVLATEANGKKHYYYRFYNENGIELFTRSTDKERYTRFPDTEYYARVFVPCNGYMLYMDLKYRLDEILKKLPVLVGGVYGEVERIFNSSMSNPNRYADMDFARILNRMEEAEKHNAPITEQREAEYKQRQIERAEQERREKEAAEQEYTQTITKAEKALLAGEMVENPRIHGKSLVLQLFREHNIELPLRTQGWVNNSLISFSYMDGYFQARCNGRISDPFMNGVVKLHGAVLTKQQFLENANTDEEQTDMETELSNDNGMEP